MIVHALFEDFDTSGNDVLVCTRSTDNGATWSPPAPIGVTRWGERPKVRTPPSSGPPSAQAPSSRSCAARQDAIPELDGTHEVYPGTLTMLPGDRILCTWDCGSALCVHLAAVSRHQLT